MAADGNMEVVVEKDVLVDEFTRSETTHEQKVIFQVVLEVSPFSFVTLSSLLPMNAFNRHHYVPPF